MRQAMENMKDSTRVYTKEESFVFDGIGRSSRPRWNVSGIEIHGIWENYMLKKYK